MSFSDRNIYYVFIILHAFDIRYVATSVQIVRPKNMIIFIQNYWGNKWKIDTSLCDARRYIVLNLVHRVMFEWVDNIIGIKNMF